MTDPTYEPPPQHPMPPDEPEPTPQDEDEGAMEAEDRYLDWLWGRDEP